MRDGYDLGQEPTEIVGGVQNLNQNRLGRYTKMAISIWHQGAGDRSDLDEAIVLHREALNLRPAPNPDRSSSLNSLAVAIQMRSEQAGDHSDLDEAIVLHREALYLLPAPNLDRPISLDSLISPKLYNIAQV